jgi:hypothetical protein
LQSQAGCPLANCFASESGKDAQVEHGSGYGDHNAHRFRGVASLARAAAKYSSDQRAEGNNSYQQDVID